ncbi:MAG: HAMP domain-containing protein [Chitinophagaceae bacterium]|nr:HAMP domain-containing protein [Chitinophagaceae bacterium]
MKRRFSLHHFSLQQRLPLLICILLLSVIFLFSLTAYVAVRKSATTIGKDRLRSLSDQLSSMLSQSASSQVLSARVTAENKELKAFLVGEKNAADTSAVMNSLRAARVDSTYAEINLVDKNGNILLRSGSASVSKQATIDTLVKLALGKDSVRIGKLRLANDTMFYPIISLVRDNAHLLGFVIRWRVLKSTPQANQQLSMLLGTNAAIYIGNDDGSLWTDMIKPVKSLPVDTLSKHEFFDYTNHARQPVIAAVRAIPATRWLVLVELSEESMMAAAAIFFKWVIVIGIVFTIVGIVTTWILSRNITRPLEELTAAATAIAGGDYSQHVPLDRKDEIGKLARAFNAMSVRVVNSQKDLEGKVQERTERLEDLNKELEAFSYSVSHDLRAPLRAIGGYAVILKEDYIDVLDKEGNRIIDRIIANGKRMGMLIDDLLQFSRLGRKELSQQSINMRQLVEPVVNELLHDIKGKKPKIEVLNIPDTHGDATLLRQVWENLISNAIKYSSKKDDAVITIGGNTLGDDVSYFVRDNGVGFDMKYYYKLFGVFQRLHSQESFEGTGIGLALAKRIIDKHNGKLHAEAVQGEGATFSFTLPKYN